jgi:hypothetical protein
MVFAVALMSGCEVLRSADFRMNFHFEHFLKSAGTVTKLEERRTRLYQHPGRRTDALS